MGGGAADRARLTETGEKEVRPRLDEVVIAVAAAGVNNADLLQRRGHYPVPAWAPRTLGLECAGTVTRVGADVTGWSPADRVCALLDGGGYANEVAVPATRVMPIPAGLSMDVLPLFATGAIRVVVDTVVPMAEAARAHELVESKRTVGKVVLDNAGAHA